MTDRNIPPSVGLNLGRAKPDPAPDRVMVVIPNMARGPTSHEADERIAAKLRARETSAPRTVEPDSIDSADLAARDRPSAAEVHAADLTELLERANASNARMAKSLARHEAERRLWAAKLAEAQRPRQHGLVSSLLTLLRGDR